MSFTIAVRQGPARLAQRLPELARSSAITKAAAPIRSFHGVAQKPLLQQQKTQRLGASYFTTSRVASSTTRNAFARARFYSNGPAAAQQQQQGGFFSRRLLVGGAIFGGTLVAINLVFNRETREDGGMPVFEREYLNNTFLHTGLGVGIIGLTARQMVNTGFVYRIMVTNPWVVAIGGLALSFGTMIATRSIAPDK